MMAFVNAALALATRRPPLRLVVDNGRPPSLAKVRADRRAAYAARWKRIADDLRFVWEGMPTCEGRDLARMRYARARCWQHHWTWLAGGDAELAEEFRLDGLAERAFQRRAEGER